MVLIATRLYGTSTPPNVLITVTGLSLGTAVFNIYRQASGEAAELVRGGISRVPTSDAYVLVDVSPPLGRPVIYTAETFAAGSPVGGQVSSAPLTVPTPAGKHVLSNPVTGDAVLVDLVRDDDTRTNVAQASAFHPAGRDDTVVVYDVRLADSGTLVVYTGSRAEAQALVDLLAAGGPVVSRHPNDGCDIASVEYLWFSDTARKRRTVRGDRLHSLPFLTVANPDPDKVPSLVTLGDLATYYGPTGTLAQLATGHATLLAIAQDTFGAV